MKETLKFFKQQAVEAKDVAKIQWKSFLAAISVVGFFYSMGLLFPPGWLSYAFCVPPAVIVLITALARVNDIGPEQMSTRWQVRKISLIMVGTGSAMIIGIPLAAEPYFPTWRLVILLYGVAGAWMTTVGQPPWDYYITGKYRFLTHPPGYVRSPLERALTRITGELSTEKLMEAQRQWEEEQAALEAARKRGSRRGDGE